MNRFFIIRLSRLHVLTTHILVLLLFLTNAWGEENIPNEKMLSLQAAYRLALKQNEYISASWQRLRQSDADIGIATSALLPQINIQAEAVNQKEHPNIPDNYNDISISAYQSLFKGGKNWYNRSAAILSAESESQRHFRLKQEVLYTVAQRFYFVILARHSITISENQLMRAKTQFDRSQQLVALGMTNETALLRARVQVAVAEENLERSKNQYLISMERLSLELGTDLPPIGVKEPEERVFTNDPLATYIDKGLKYRTDIQSAELQVKAAESDVKAEQSDFIPDFFIEGSYVQSDTDALYYGDKNDWDVALKASYPLYTGHRNTSEVTKSKARLAETRANLKRLKQETKVKVRSVYYDILTQQKVITNIKDQVAAASANYQQVTAQFNEGVSSSVDVVDAETALNEAETQLARSYYRFQLDQLRMDLATGTLEKDLLNTNNQDFTK